MASDQTYNKLLGLSSTAAAQAMDDGVGALHVGARVLDAIWPEIENLMKHGFWPTPRKPNG